MLSVGERIRKMRIGVGMSQVDFAKAIGVSKQTLYKYENDIITNIPSDKIEAAAKICNVTPGYLMGWEEPFEERNLYMLDSETASIAQTIFDNRDLRNLFKVAIFSKHNDLKMATDLLSRLNATEEK